MHPTVIPNLMRHIRTISLLSDPVVTALLWNLIPHSVYTHPLLWTIRRCLRLTMGMLSLHIRKMLLQSDPLHTDYPLLKIHIGELESAVWSKDPILICSCVADSATHIN